MFYVRMSCPWLEKAPQSLTIRCGNTTTSSSSHNNCNGGLNSSLEINRAKIFPSQMGVSLTLRRDRMDADSAEAIYVCTDMVRTSDSFPFFICDDQEETLVCANIKRSCSYGPPSISKMSNNWSLECSYVSSSKAQLCNGNGLLNVGADCDNISCMEICVAGRDSNHNSPVILSRTLQLVGGAPTSTRRVARHCRRNSYSTLDVILEHDENENDAADNGDGYAVFGYESSKEAFMVDSNLSRQVLALSFCFSFLLFFNKGRT